MQQDVLNFMGAAKNNVLICVTKARERHDLAKKKKLWVQNKGGAQVIRHEQLTNDKKRHRNKAPRKVVLDILGENFCTCVAIQVLKPSSKLQKNSPLFEFLV